MNQRRNVVNFPDISLSKKQKTLLIFWGSLIFILLLILLFGKSILDLIFSIKEHNALGYSSVYIKQLLLSIESVVGSGLVVLILSGLSMITFRKQVSKWVYILLWIIACVVGWVVGYGLGHIDPTSWLLFFHHSLFHKTDPIFHIDMSFYVYTLPILASILAKLMGAVIYFIMLRLIVTLLLTGMRYIGREKHIQTVRYLSRLAALFFVLIAADTFLGRYTILFTASEGKFVYGPGFTDTHLTIPVAIGVKAIFSLLTALALLLFSFKKLENEPLYRLKNYKFILWPFGALIGFSILFGFAAIAINQFYVHPNQQTVEAPYIKRTIDATRWAVDINKVKAKPFKAAQTLSNSTINQNQNLLDNTRINDIGQTKEIYNQLQSFKNYFVFEDANADRYNGQQVYLDVRQLDNSKLPVQTWINKKLVYTHGYGVTASYVNRFDDKGLPVPIAQNTPQETKAPLPKITQPNIYFGTMNNEVIAPSKQGEFDYPQKSLDHTSHYMGGYNLPIQGNKLLLAIEKGSLKYLTSGQFTSDSQLIFDRNIYTRVKDIAPFINYNSDAFPFVTDDGHVKWMMDAFTESRNIPYAQNFSGTSYIRNSLKVVVDAYTGKVTYYVINKNDPMIQSLMLVYPNLFTTKIPSDVARHFRYPKDLFQIQSRAITSYHMTSPAAFYNQEDLWSIAKEVYAQNETKDRGSVYQMIQMPGETKPSFVLSDLFTPNNKSNLNGWLIASNEPSHYGELTLYQFPQDRLFFGPMQVENQIDSNTDISSQLSLWNQNGSHVIRGNLLLVPIGNTAIYIEPVYLVANRSGALPQLQRVIVDFNEQVYMGNNLADALQQLVAGIAGENPDTGSNQGSPNTNPDGNGQKNGNGGTGQNQGGAANASIQDLAKQANQLLDQYKKDTANGNLSQAGKDMEQVQSILEQMLQKK